MASKYIEELRKKRKKRKKKKKKVEDFNVGNSKYLQDQY